MGNTENTLITGWDKLFPSSCEHFLTASIRTEVNHTEEKTPYKIWVIFFRIKFGVLTVTENLPQYSGEMEEDIK